MMDLDKTEDESGIYENDESNPDANTSLFLEKLVEKMQKQNSPERLLMQRVNTET